MFISISENVLLFQIDVKILVLFNQSLMNNFVIIFIIKYNMMTYSMKVIYFDGFINYDIIFSLNSNHGCEWQRLDTKRKKLKKK